MWQMFLGGGEACCDSHETNVAMIAMVAMVAMVAKISRRRALSKYSMKLSIVDCRDETDGVVHDLPTRSGRMHNVE